jgi:hypothetical protein
VRSERGIDDAQQESDGDRPEHEHRRARSSEGAGGHDRALRAAGDIYDRGACANAGTSDDGTSDPDDRATDSGTEWVEYAGGSAITATVIGRAGTCCSSRFTD